MKQLLLITLVLFAASLKGQEKNKDKVNASHLMVLYFPWDKDDLRRDYMDNNQALQDMDRFFSNSILLSEMDSVVVSATASPEGPPIYNQKLSERRLATVIRFLLQKYPTIAPEKIRAHALGAHWSGLYEMVESDLQVPFRDEVLQLIESSIDKASMERKLHKIGKGVAYQYLKQNILPYLRIGGTCVIFYPKQMEVLQLPIPEQAKLPVIKPLVPSYTLREARQLESYKYIRPFALKTNLLFDAATLFNVELEVPLGKQWSLTGEWIFPWWGGLGNNGGISPVPRYSEKFTMQMLSGGLEARYWFPRSRTIDLKAKRWSDYNPLSGWFVGLYSGAGKYDFQWKGDGMQGEFFIASGISAGYAHPIAKHWHMEYSLGVGYLRTEYYNYTAKDGHKVVDILPGGQYDRRSQVWFGPTKMKISLVWMPRIKVRNRHK